MNVVASASARWRPLMDCECSRKMAGEGIWGRGAVNMSFEK